MLRTFRDDDVDFTGREVSWVSFDYTTFSWGPGYALRAFRDRGFLLLFGEPDFSGGPGYHLVIPGREVSWVSFETQETSRLVSP